MKLMTVDRREGSARDQVYLSLREAIVSTELKPGQKLATLRLAVSKLMDAEKRDLHWGVRGETIYISKGLIPGGRGGRRRKTA